MEQLSDAQLNAFDYEFINDRRWGVIKSYIERDFSNRKFTFLDIGGGNGLFADRILMNYSESKGIVFDNSKLLLEKNKFNNRKELMFGSAENLERCVSAKFDFVILNLVLHHFVSRSSYSRSRNNIDHVLQSASKILTKNGRVLIFEQMFNGILFDGAPSLIIYYLTSQKLISKLVKNMGANTAGIGVCFSSYRQLCSAIDRSDYQFEYTNDETYPIPLVWKIFLNIGHFHTGFFWLRPKFFGFSPNHL